MDDDTAADDESSKEDIEDSAGVLGSTVNLVLVTTMDKLVFSVLRETMDDAANDDDDEESTN